MDQPQKSSLLEYARFHGIAIDPTTINPLTYIDETSENDCISNHETLSTFENHSSIVRGSIEQGLRSEKLNVGKNDARFLSTVIRDARAERVEVNWAEYLPSMRRIEGLKVETPALASHHETDVASLGKHTYFSRGAALLKGCLSYPLADSSDGLIKASDDIANGMRNEKLNCSKGPLVLLQNAVRCGGICPTDMARYFETTLRPYQSRLRKPDTPLIPMDFDELHSPSPTPKPQMLPSPVSSDRFGQYEKYGLAIKSMEVACLRGPRTSNSPRYEDKQPSVIQLEEELGLSNQDEAPLGRSHEPPLSTETGIRNEEMIELREGVFNGASNQLDEHHCPVQPMDSMVQEEEARPEAGLVFEQDSNINSTFQLSSLKKTVNNREIGVPLSHPDEFHSDTQRSTGEMLFKSQEIDKSSNALNKAYLVAEIDNREVASGAQCVSRIHQAYPIPTVEGIESQEVSSTACEEAKLTPNLSTSIKMSAPDDNKYDQPQTCPSDERSKKQKRKSTKTESSSRKERCRSKQKLSIDSLAVRKDSTTSSAFTALGSLSAFMETRGKACRRRVNATSPYFMDKNKQSNDDKEKQEASVEAKADIDMESNKQKEQGDISLIATPPRIPQRQRNSQRQPLLFLSTSLLKSHLRLVQIFENMKDPPPTLIYRDYDKSPLSRSNHELQNEADIIIAPSTGILLTTSQATTQLYLPGHKPKCPRMDGIKGINSPLRERIVLLAPRYERLYMLVCHSGGAARKQSQTKFPGPTADKRTLTFMTSLMAFCTSASGHSTITPLLISPSTPETIAEWILSLAHKHSFQLPEPSMTIPQNTISFTPINPTSHKKATLDPVSMEPETQWELFLRRAGLNPFAAQVILAVLKNEEESEVASLCLRGEHVAGSSDGIEIEVTKASGVSRFVEMASEQRRRLFVGLVGERVLGRVEGVIELDWQCDWALDFNAIGDGV